MRSLASLSSLALAASLLAQDADRSFAPRIPSTLDPSRTGASAAVNAALIHQDQWLQVPGAWRNELLHVDLCLRNRRKKMDKWIGAGLDAAVDRSPASGWQRTHAAIRTAVHLRSGQRSYLAAGLGTALVNATMNAQNGAWGSQYDGLRYDASLPSQEAWTTDASTWFEARAGVSFTLKRAAESPRRREPDILTAGLAADHLGRLVLREAGQRMEPLPMRATAYVLSEMHHRLWENGLFSGELIGHLQGPFHTGRLNFYAGKHLLNSVRNEGGPPLFGFKAGLGYKYLDAVLVNVIIDYGRLSFGMTYGWSVGAKDRAVNGRRTFELLLQWSTR
ncbi:MAG TPA: type IX secretion system membrane protein PorP/SprF [Flavobacteriales bacterium]|nr:type IX secretion system membrane protein PorP/SprF [Flavobacteriales bacterium]HNU56139.1 type IX secretion system membrane protein PorP/SprF [Flavobacteriales bacterium]